MTQGCGGEGETAAIATVQGGNPESEPATDTNKVIELVTSVTNWNV